MVQAGAIFAPPPNLTGTQYLSGDENLWETVKFLVLKGLTTFLHFRNIYSFLDGWPGE